MQVAVGKDDEPAVLRFGVLARLLFADQRIFVFGLGFEDDEGEAFFVQKQEIDEAFAGFFKVIAECVQCLGSECDFRLKLNIGRATIVGEETPICCFKQLIDFYSGSGFFSGHV